MFDATDGNECRQIYAIVAAAVARAIASCRPSGPLQSTQKVVVSAKYSPQQLQVTVADTGRAIVGVKEVAAGFQQAFPEGCVCLCNTLHVRSTGLQESVTRQYIVKAGSPSSRSAPAVAESPCATKRCPHGPFSGSQASFSVPDAACAPLHALDAITAALEAITMVAPPVALTLCISGFEALLQSAGLEPLPKKLKYDLEPLPSNLTPLERMKRGFAAFFGAEVGVARDPDLAAASSQDVHLLGSEGAHVEHMGNNEVSVFLSSSISAAQTAVDQDSIHPTPLPVSARAMLWSASAALVHTNTPLTPGAAQGGEITSLSDPGGSPAPSRLLLFENYAQLQRPQQALLKAISRSTFWQSFGVVVQSLSLQADGSAELVFAPGSAATAGRIQLIAVHVVCADIEGKRATKSGRPAGLSSALEVKLVRRAIEGALAAVKGAHPLELLSLFEHRMSCLDHIARSVARIVQDNTDDEFQERACELAGCAPHDMAETIQEQLERLGTCF